MEEFLKYCCFITAIKLIFSYHYRCFIVLHFRVHIPRVLTICGFLFGFSGLLCSLPHFIFDGRSSIDEARKSDNESSDHFLCKADNLTMGLNCDQTEPQHYASQSGWVVLYITLCYVIQGVAKSPRSSLGSVYLDSSAEKSKTGLYLGIVYEGQHIHVIYLLGL